MKSTLGFSRQFRLMKKPDLRSGKIIIAEALLTIIFHDPILDTRRIAKTKFHTRYTLDEFLDYYYWHEDINMSDELINFYHLTQVKNKGATQCHS